MSDARQTSVREHLDDGPEIGMSFAERTHYAHVRYAAGDEPGVIWFDPRDGREKFALDVDVTEDDLDVGERVLTRVSLRAHRKRAQEVSPDDAFVVEFGMVLREEFEPLGLDEVPDTHLATVSESVVCEDLHAARELARERCSEYAAAEYRDAVAARTEEVRES